MVRGAWIHERQTLDATVAAGGSVNAKNTLKVLRLNASYYPEAVDRRERWLLRYAGARPTPGSMRRTLSTAARTASPKTNGFVGEVDLNPWENTRFGLQYTAYSNFNGGKTNYDGSGRDASGNNTLFAFAWLAF